MDIRKEANELTELLDNYDINNMDSYIETRALIKEWEERNGIFANDVAAIVSIGDGKDAMYIAIKKIVEEGK